MEETDEHKTAGGGYSEAQVRDIKDQNHKLPDEAVIEAIRAALLQKPDFRPDAKVLRLHYSPAVGGGFPVDLVAFDGVEISAAQVARLVMTKLIA